MLWRDKVKSEEGTVVENFSLKKKENNRCDTLSKTQIRLKMCLANEKGKILVGVTEFFPRHLFNFRL